MPLPMVHLAVAIQLRSKCRDPLTPTYLLGSIAPDAIHTRPNATHTEKHVVHLRQAIDDLEEHRVQDLMHRYERMEPNVRDFAEGYVVHLLTDWIWFTTLHPAFCRHLPPDLSDDDIQAIYYQETDQIDFNLYHQATWRPQIWEQLASATPIDFDGLLTAQEIGQWQQRVLNWFGGLKQEPKIQPRYITEAEIHQFIEQAAAAIIAKFPILCRR